MTRCMSLQPILVRAVLLNFLDALNAEAVGRNVHQVGAIHRVFTHAVPRRVSGIWSGEFRFSSCKVESDVCYVAFVNINI